MHRTRRQFASMLVLGAASFSLAPAKAALSPDDVEGLLNVFISPSGKPFRAPRGAPYPVVDWFKEADRNGDGKISHAEFIADAEAFFRVLDSGHTGVLGPYEIAVYEHRIAPEILGYEYKPTAEAQPPGLFGGRLWRAQFGGIGGAGGGVPTSIDPGGGQSEPDLPKIPHDLDETQQGASPSSLFDEPEPVTAADFDFNGKIKKENYLRLADLHFTRLDVDNVGYLTLAKLPKTAVQKRIEKLTHKRR